MTPFPVNLDRAQRRVMECSQRQEEIRHELAHLDPSDGPARKLTADEQQQFWVLTREHEALHLERVSLIRAMSRTQDARALLASAETAPVTAVRAALAAAVELLGQSDDPAADAYLPHVRQTLDSRVR